MTLPKLVMFDLDGTLSESKQPLTGEMAMILARLMTATRVAIISGGALPQFLSQVVAQLPADAHLANLYLLPTSGGALYEYTNGDWQQVYENTIPTEDLATIKNAMRAGAEATRLIDFSRHEYGERIEFRGAQVTLSALGQQAPPDVKKLWDPTRAKRLALCEQIEKLLPSGYDIAIGGTTSVDVVMQGIDKAYGIRELAKHLALTEADITYVGDELGEHGNDHPAEMTEATCIPVKTLAQTRELIEDMLAS